MHAFINALKGKAWNVRRAGLMVLLLLPLSSFAQKDDLGLWLSVDGEKKLSKKASIEAEAEMRFNDNISAVDRFSFSVAGNYRIAKWLKADLGYVFLDYRKPGGLTDGEKYYNSTYWYPRHRGFVSLTESVRLGDVKISIRERFQYTYSPSFDRNRMNMSTGDVTQKRTDSQVFRSLRIRFAGTYNIPNSKFEPYAAIELFNPLGGVCFGTVRKAKYTVGTSYKINKRHQVNLNYSFLDRTGYDPEDDFVQDQHVIGVGYGISF